MDLMYDEKIQNYISEVCSQVRFREIHQDVRLELEAHLQEVIEEYLTQGFSETETIEKAIAQMGDADIIGKQLNKVHKPKPEWSVLLFSFLFINLGLIAMYFIQRQDLLAYNIPVFENSLLFSVIGIIPIAALYFFDYRKLEKYSKHIYLGTFLLLIFTILWGNQFNGSRSWLILGPLSINFVNISPLLFILALAGIFNKWNWNDNLMLLKGLALSVLPLILILTESSISTGVIYITACIVIMIVSGVRLKKIIFMSLPFMAILILNIISKPYILNMLLTFLNPGSDPLRSGYVNTQLGKIIPAAGFFGQGLTFDPQTLPCLHTDFIFAFITYTFGWIVSILLIAFVLMFIVRIIGIAKQVKINYAKLLISGFVSILTVQFLWNILMNLGLAPISDLGLPFISYGGSQLIINAATVGIISSIYRRKNISQAYKDSPIV